MRLNRVQWLYDELPVLVRAGVLSEDAARRIRQHYGPVAQVAFSKIAVLLCGVFAALLIGLGIILLLAHNWDGLSRPLRTALAFAPLAAGQLLAAWTLWKRDDSAAWREGSGTFLALSIGACIALIGQTYHIPGNLSSFLLTWLLLGLPLVYVLRSTTVALLYAMGVTAWAAESQWQTGAPAYWPLMLLVLPHVIWVHSLDARGARAFLTAWGFSICLCVGLGIVLEGTPPGTWILAYSALLTVFLLAGRIWYPGALRHPFTWLGSLGTVGLALLLTFDDTWRDIGYAHHHRGDPFQPWGAVEGYIVVALLLILATILLLHLLRKDGFGVLPWGAAPAVALIGFALVLYAEQREVPLILYNLYLLILGILTFGDGIRKARLGRTNAGMAILSVLVVARFFDSDLSFSLRGILFILLGTGFLAANVLLARRYRSQEEEAP